MCPRLCCKSTLHEFVQFFVSVIFINIAAFSAENLIGRDYVFNYYPKKGYLGPQGKENSTSVTKKMALFREGTACLSTLSQEGQLRPPVRHKNQHSRGFIGTSLHFKIYLLQLYPGPMISPTRLWPSSF